MQQAKLYQDRKLLFVDTAGNYVSFCERLAKDWGKVYYYCPNYSGWPDLKKSMVGERLKDVKVIEQMWWKYMQTLSKEFTDFVHTTVTRMDEQDVKISALQTQVNNQNKSIKILQQEIIQLQERK